MKGGQKGLQKGVRVSVNYGTGPPVEGKIFQSQGTGNNPNDTLLYKVQWEDGKPSGWISEDKVMELSGNPPEPPSEGQGRRKTRRRKHKRKTSKRKKPSRR
jgi:hypothetical protein